MPAFNNPAISKFGIINETPSPSVRAFQADVESGDITEASFREGMSNDEDPEGVPYIGGMASEIAFGGLDQSPKSQAETWSFNQTPVQMVAVTPDLFIQWYSAQRLLTDQSIDVTQVNLEAGMYMMTREGGDHTSHNVYVSRNGLLYLAPTSGGWDDSDSSGVADGYTTADLNGTAFSSAVQEFYVDTGDGSGSLYVDVPFPVDNVEVTLSAEHTQIHDDGDQAIRIEALDGSKSLIGSNFSDVGVSSTGRKHADLTTPSGTYYLRCYPARVTSVSANTSKAKVKNPALRVDGSSTYVAR